jgi:murein DD-endopeptidase MepM/ murein hydrolase activator NlpD
MEKYKTLKITCPFGEKYDPFNLNPDNQKKWEIHRGIDFRPDKYFNVWAGFPSTIRIISKGEKEGRYIQLMLKINNIFFYINLFHLEKINFNIKEMEEVKINDVIARAGNTGNSTGIHIHYEIFTYNLESPFIIELKKYIKNYILNEIPKTRIFFDPIQLYDYCIDNKLLEVTDGNIK